MPWQAFEIQFLLPPFLLVLFRVSGLAIASPLIGSRAIPPQVKIALTLVLSLMIFPIVLSRTPNMLPLGSVVVTVFGELVIGLIIGLTLELVFLGVRLTGTVIGQQAGIALGQVFNPMLEGRSSIIGQLYYLVTLMIFLAVGGHRAMVRALLDSFERIPPGRFHFTESMLTLFEQLLSAAFVMGMRLAAPTLTALFIASVTMGFVARTIPQLNILTIGFSVRIFVGFSVAAVSLALAYDLIYDAILNSFVAIRGTLGLGG